MGSAPRPPAIATVDALPKSVHDLFVEAEHSFAEGRMILAAMGYRAALERAVKDLNPTATGTLFKRIENMNGTLPQGLIDLMREVRFLGNEAAHDMTPDAKDVEAGRDFARLFFVYTYELPARVSAAVDRRNEAKAGAG